jgi:2'-5' RNA ligase
VPHCGDGERAIGVSLRVPEPFARELGEARRSFGDAQWDKVAPHITLIPPTCVPTDDGGRVGAHIAGQCAGVEPFTVHLRSTGTFRPLSPVVFVQVVEGISSCERLAARLRSGPLAQEPAFPYHPHVTVAHEVPEPALDRAFAALAGFEAVFRVETVELFREDPDGVWRADQAFALGGAP